MPTMLDIAVKAGVSRSTVSFVLNDKHSQMGVNEETRRRVLRVADEMGYRRNGIARAIATGKMPVFAYLVQGDCFDTEVSARVMYGIIEEADTCHHTVQVLRLSQDNHEEVIQRCVELRPAGVIGLYVAVDILPHLQCEMSRLSIPVAMLDSTPAPPGSSHILSDDIQGCLQAITHLTSLGHRRIAFIGGLTDTVASLLREEGYRRAMADRGLEIPHGYLERGYWQIEPTEAATRRLFRDHPYPPTALFCADDKTAMVACRILREFGLRVPEDVSVVGYAGLVMAEYNDPPLTTIAQPFREMGQAAVRRLLAMSGGSKEKNEKGESPESCFDEWMPTRLLLRRSTAPVKE